MTAGPGSVAPGNQLELGLGVPRLAIEPEWKAQTRLWGHSLHPMCSYLASFPAALAHAFVARYSRPGDVVLDPFSGAGTAPLQAAAEGRIGVGNDLNPFAHLLTAAKVETPTVAEARTRATALRLAWAGSAAHVARPRGRDPGRARRRAARSPCPTRSRSRSTRGRSPRSCSCATRSTRDGPVDRFLAAALAGILHGKTPSYLSTLMPNTFSMAPRYVRDFAARTGVQLAGAGRVRPARRQADPPVPRPAAPRDAGSRSSATRATRARAPPRRSGPAACRTACASS